MEGPEQSQEEGGGVSPPPPLQRAAFNLALEWAEKKLTIFESFVGKRWPEGTPEEGVAEEGAGEGGSTV